MLRLNSANTRGHEESVALFDIIAHAGQETNLANPHPEKLQTIRKDFDMRIESVKACFAGQDDIQ